MTAGAHLNAVRAAGRQRMLGHDQQNRRKDDFYPTPLRGITALLDVERFEGPIWEPACGDGAISRVLAERGHEVVSSDLIDRGHGETGIDFLLEWRPRAPNIITNPPFKLAVPFARRAIELTSGKVAMLLKIAFLEGIERSRLFRETPLARCWVFSQRLSFQPGGSTEARSLEGGGMMAFGWFVWDHQHSGPPTLGWI